MTTDTSTHIDPEDYSAQVRLFSPMEPVSIAIRLKKEMKARKSWMKAHVSGRGTQHAMKLTYIGPALNASLQPALNAKMIPYNGGTLIEGELSQVKSWKTAAKQLGCFALVVLLISGLMIAMRAYIMALIGMSFFGTVIFIIWRQQLKELKRDDRAGPNVILDFLSETMNARQIDSIPKERSSPSI